MPTTQAPAQAAPSSSPLPTRTGNRFAFADFDRRARAGENLSVVFFGCSLTWGANASDPQLTSYRARMAEKFEQSYPKAHFKFWDAAIGGTNSQLGVFRFERDVKRRKPDLVFLDFTLNDDHTLADPETLASYESLVRRTILETNCPAVLVFFPGAEDVQSQAVLPRDEAHRTIGTAYGAAIGDAVTLMRRKAQQDPTAIAQWWPHPTDQTHPGDRGYEQYAEAAWNGYRQAIEKRLVSHAPASMLHQPTYMSWQRQRLTQLAPLPQGWKAGTPNRISAWYDALMSRWLDDEVIATQTPNSAPAPWKITFKGSMALLFGESTPNSGKLKVLIDGQPSTHAPKGIFNLSSKGIGGNTKWATVVATGLNPKESHTIELIPQLEEGQELRIESLCTAGS